MKNNMKIINKIYPIIFMNTYRYIIYNLIEDPKIKNFRVSTKN